MGDRAEVVTVAVAGELAVGGRARCGVRVVAGGVDQLDRGLDQRITVRTGELELRGGGPCERRLGQEPIVQMSHPSFACR